MLFSRLTLEKPLSDLLSGLLHHLVNTDREETDHCRGRQQAVGQAGEFRRRCQKAEHTT